MNEQIDANVETAFKVKFDHVAMDNFHAVLDRISELMKSPFMLSVPTACYGKKAPPTSKPNLLLGRHAMCYPANTPTFITTQGLHREKWLKFESYWSQVQPSWPLPSRICTLL